MKAKRPPALCLAQSRHIRADMCDLYSLTKGQSASFSDKKIALVDDSIVGLELGAPSSHGPGGGSLRIERTCSSAQEERG